MLALHRKDSQFDARSKNGCADPFDGAKNLESVGKPALSFFVPARSHIRAVIPLR